MPNNSPATPAATSAAVPDPAADARASGYATWLTQNLRNGAVKSALRGADHPQTVHLAYPYLAPFWNDTTEYAIKRQQALFAHAAVIARTGIRHEPGATLGRVARTLADRKGISPGTINTMVNVIYKNPIRLSTRTIEALLQVAAQHNLGVDYSSLFNQYYWWDVKPTRPSSARRRFLNDYYTTHPTLTETENN